MAVFVNYYPCSYGDSLVKMFSGQPLSRHNGVVQSAMQFKQQEFYDMPVEQQQDLLLRLGDDDIVSCHRQKSFDFGSQHRVVSIDLDRLDFLPRRISNVHIGKYPISGPWTKSRRLTQEQMILADYQHWRCKNILPDDTILPITTVINGEKLQEFCQTQQLRFDTIWATDIKKDFELYDCVS